MSRSLRFFIILAALFTAPSSQAFTCKVLDSIVLSSSDADYPWQNFELPSETMFSRGMELESCSFNVSLVSGRYSFSINEKVTRDGSNTSLKEWQGGIQLSYSRQNSGRVCMMTCEK